MAASAQLRHAGDAEEALL